MISLVVAATVMLHGEVQQASGAPIARARVTWGGIHSATTEADGRFSIAPGSSWPDDLTVSAPGFGTRIIPVHRVHATSRLAPIVLRSGATIRMHINRGRERRPLDLNVGIVPDDDKPRWIAHQHIPERGQTAVVSGLSTGVYVVLIQGAEPMQTATVKVGIADGESRDVAITLPTDRRLHVKVISGGLPVKNIRVQFSNADTHWSGAITTNASGVIDTPIWDGGRFQVFVRRIEGAVSVMRNTTLTANRSLTIDVPTRVIRGRVVGDDDAPIAGATVTLAATVQDGRVTAHGKTDPHGFFTFDSVEPGVPSLYATAPGFLQGAPVPVPHSGLVLTLSRGVPRAVVVLWADHSPVALADILCVTNDGIRSRAITGDDGRVTIATPLIGRSTLYVIPREGSFAIAQLGVPAEERRASPLMVTVPEANASLTIAARTSADKPLSTIAFIMRVNGETVPKTVAEELERRQGLQLRTEADGEAHLDYLGVGRYEFWPYRSDEERADVLESLGLAAAPIDVVVEPGTNRATVRFQ